MQRRFSRTCWMNAGWMRAGVVGLLVLAAGMAGCEGPPNRVVKYPPEAIRVMYEEATTYSTCLVASVAMAANYVLNRHAFSENGIRDSLRRAGRDETLVRDLKAFLADEGLHLVTLRGSLDVEPPTGLGYWVASRRYPVICVINRDPVDPAFNHAVVVIGISPNPTPGAADIIHYFDPSSKEELHSEPAPAFEVLWARAQYAMMIVVTPATGSGSDPAGGVKETR